MSCKWKYYNNFRQFNGINIIRFIFNLYVIDNQKDSCYFYQIIILFSTSYLWLLCCFIFRHVFQYPCYIYDSYSLSLNRKCWDQGKCQCKQQTFNHHFNFGLIKNFSKISFIEILNDVLLYLNTYLFNELSNLTFFEIV